MTNLLYTFILLVLPAAGAGAGEGADGLFSLSGTWYARAGFDSTWLADASTEGWTAVRLPGTLDGFGHRERTGPFLTVKRVVSRLPGKEGGSSVLRGFSSSYAAAYFLNGHRIGTCGSDDPYVHAFGARVTRALAPHMFNRNGDDVLSFVLYRDPRFMDTPDASGGTAAVGTLARINPGVIADLMMTTGLMSLYVIVGLYHLLLGIRHPADRYNPLFSAFCLVFAVFTLTNNDLGYLAFPPETYLLARLDRISVKILGPVFMLFLSYLFTGKPDRISRWWAYYCGALLLIDVFAPVHFNFCPYGHCSTLDAWMAGLAVCVPVMLYRTWKQVRTGNRDAMLIGGGMVLFFGAVMHDLSYYMDVINVKTTWTSAAFPLFILNVAFILANRYAHVRTQVEHMNVTLETMVGERTRSLDDALAAQKRTTEELHEFVQLASHDLREPLRKIRSFGSRIAVECSIRPADKGRAYLGHMRTSAHRMTDLLDDLIQYNRVTSSRRPMGTVDLAKALNDVREESAGKIRETGARIASTGLGTVAGDAVLLRQLLRQLLDNALKYRQPGVPPDIRVTGRVHGDVFELSVADKGIGIEPEHYDKVFGVFEQLHGRHEYEGTGMGLAICKKIAERHGGSIGVTSVPGDGTVFTVRFPAATRKGGA